MMGLDARFGFSKVLGLGHVLWIPLVIYVAFHIPRADAGFKMMAGARVKRRISNPDLRLQAIEQFRGAVLIGPSLDVCPIQAVSLNRHDNSDIRVAGTRGFRSVARVFGTGYHSDSRNHQ